MGKSFHKYALPCAMKHYAMAPIRVHQESNAHSVSFFTTCACGKVYNVSVDSENAITNEVTSSAIAIEEWLEMMTEKGWVEKVTSDMYGTFSYLVKERPMYTY